MTNELGCGFSFDRDSFEVAPEMKGAKLLVGDWQATISSVEAFSREENDIRQWRMLLNLPVASVASVPFMQGSVLCVVTREGGCVKLQAIELKKPNHFARVLRGPGVVARELGFEKKEVRRLIVEEDSIPPVLRIVS